MDICGQMAKFIVCYIFVRELIIEFETTCQNMSLCINSCCLSLGFPVKYRHLMLIAVRASVK